jgi:hypothetical protein
MKYSARYPRRLIIFEDPETIYYQQIDEKGLGNKKYMRPVSKTRK